MPVKTVQVTETYEMPDFVSDVERGMALLDEKLGPRWVLKVDPKMLDLSDGSYCVVGQLAIRAALNGPLEGYHEGIRKIFPDLKEENDPREEAHGFVVGTKQAQALAKWMQKQPSTHPWWPLFNGPTQYPNTSGVGTYAFSDLLYDYLTSIWLQVIKARRSALRKQAEARRAAKKTTAPKKVAKKTVAKKTTRRR